MPVYLYKKQVNEQFPDAVEVRRKRLYPIMKHHKSAGHHVKLVRDRLYIDGQLFQDSAWNTENPRRMDDKVTSSPEEETFQKKVYTNSPENTHYINDFGKRERTASTPNSAVDRPTSRARLSSFEAGNGSFEANSHSSEHHPQLNLKETTSHGTPFNLR